MVAISTAVYSKEYCSGTWLCEVCLYLAYNLRINIQSVCQNLESRLIIFKCPVKLQTTQLTVEESKIYQGLLRGVKKTQLVYFIYLLGVHWPQLLINKSQGFG